MEVWSLESLASDYQRFIARFGGIAVAGWDRLGWRGGLAERWMRMRDRRGPLAAVLLASGYAAALLWGQLELAHSLGAPPPPSPTPLLSTLLMINAALLGWRILMRAGFTTATYGWRQGLLSIPRLVVANLIAILATKRALLLYASGGPKQWEKTGHAFPAELAR